MPAPAGFPAVADLERHGNLTLSAWAPPAHQALAEQWFTAALTTLLSAPSETYLLGHRPGLLGNLPPDAVPAPTMRLLQSLTRGAGNAPLHRIPEEIARASVAALRKGDINSTSRRLDEATGLSQTKNTHLGRALIRTTVDGALGALQGIAAPAPLQLHLSCLTNPQAGLRQPDARWLRSVAEWTGSGVGITWAGNTLVFLGGPALLLKLRNELLDWLPQRG